MQSHEIGNRRFYQADDGNWVFSENSVWCPGSYESLPTAIAAAELSDEILRKLQSRANAGTITMRDVQESGDVG